MLEKKLTVDRVRLMGDVSMKNFLTSFGDEIPLVEGYYDLHRKRNAGNLLATSTSRPGARERLSYKAFVKDVYLYWTFVDIFARQGIDISALRSLDVGGGEGTMARLLSKEGRSKFTKVVELYMMDELYSDSEFSQHYRRHRIDSFVEKCSLSKIKKTALGGPQLTHGRYPEKSSTYFSLRNRGPGTISSFSVENFFDIKEKYDLLTAFSCIDYFDPQLFFQKASDLLDVGGYFFGYLAYWWYPVNCSVVCGHFPYAAQRLNKEDFIRYAKEFHSEDFEDIMERYNYFHLGRIHPTLGEYIRMASDAGLQHVASDRIFGGPGMKLTPVQPNQIDLMSGHSLAACVDQINKFAPAVTIEDLKTYVILLAFKKV